MDYRNYPPNWKELSRAIKERDGHRCKWCGVKNYATGYRDAQGKFVAVEGLRADELTSDGVKLIKIVLTVAHLDQDTTNNDPAGLAALCQKCHLNHDQSQHVANAHRTRQKKKLESGQQRLFELE